MRMDVLRSIGPEQHQLEKKKIANSTLAPPESTTRKTLVNKRCRVAFISCQRTE
jgi:hypothetical protein